MGAKLKAERDRIGWSTEKAAAEVSRILPGAWEISRTKIARYERNEVKPRDVNPMEIAAIAAAYQSRLREISQESAQEYKRFSDQVKPYSRWSPGTAGPHTINHTDNHILCHTTCHM